MTTLSDANPYTAIPAVDVPTTEELVDAHCQEKVDRVNGDPATSAFKAAARLHQARWRESRSYPIGTQPINPNGGAKSGEVRERAEPREIGSNLALDFALRTGSNFLSDGARRAAGRRLDNAQVGEMLDGDRLYASLLSSMPMCFNLFGGLGSMEQVTRAVKTWWPDTPGSVTEVVFEWSPGRGDPEYLGNRSAFDVAFLLDLGEGARGVIGVETKYHEHATPVKMGLKRVARYEEVAKASKCFTDATVAQLLGGPHAVPPSPADPRSQIWLDHLLALSMLQHPTANWTWAQFVVVYPDANPSWAHLTAEYQELVGTGEPTFKATTFDELIAAGVYMHDQSAALVDRYRCWIPEPR